MESWPAQQEKSESLVNKQGYLFRLKLTNNLRKGYLRKILQDKKKGYPFFDPDKENALEDPPEESPVHIKSKTL